MTGRPPIIEDTDFIRSRQREIAAEHDRSATGEKCICPPGSLVVPGCPVHNLEIQRLLESSISACGCPTDHDVHGVYRKVHVPGCIAHVWSPEEISAYRHWLPRTAPDPLAIGRPERGR